MLVVNNTILNLLIKSFKQINNLIISTFVQLFFENNTFIVNSGLLKFKNMDYLVDWITKKLKTSYKILLQITYSD
jgi:hypothetical protein